MTCLNVDSVYVEHICTYKVWHGKQSYLNKKKRLQDYQNVEERVGSDGNKFLLFYINLYLLLYLQFDQYIAIPTTVWQKITMNIPVKITIEEGNKN